MPAVEANPAPASTLPAPHAARHELGDFRTDRRVLILCGLALPIGVIGALVAKFLLWLIAVITNVAFFARWSAAPVTPQESHIGWWTVLIPVIGAIIIGLMARYGSDKIRGHGIPEALEAILLGRSLIKPKVAVLKPISSAISIGTGGPFGAEGPIIMTGGACGSIFAQLFHLSAAERKTLLVAGAAAGMAGIFSTPVAAVLLAIELLLFEWKPRSFIPVALAAIVAWVVRQPLLGYGAIFPVHLHDVLGARALAVGLGLGVVTGLVSGALTGLVYTCEDWFAKLPVHWMWWPAIGALLVGIGGVIDPRVLGVGYETIHALMRGDMVGTPVLTLMIAKALVWAIALGSGTSGGVLAPLLMVGGAVGAYAAGVTGLADPSLCAMIGMAAMMGGTMRAPLTGTIFVLELTHDLNALPVLLIGSVAAVCVTVLLLRRSILTEKLARRGQHIVTEYAVDVFELSRVGDVMDRIVPVAPADMTVAELSSRIARGDKVLAHRQATILVDSQGALAGILTRGDLMRALQEENANTATALSAATREVAVAYPDEPLQDAIAKMLKRDVGRLPVVEREDRTKVIGYLGRADILAARQKWHEEEEQREKAIALRRRRVAPIGGV